ncbi:hypothetical protein AB0C86_24140 [Streptomyces lavendulae]|uniref:hypothetical protein n=1 Tax=Streptomyces lavendulae TaxID=1914 RepID=UPI0024A2046C|nr:hypothetical protein [Streptomyces lavendulae]GLW02473.1 hypothetical protein Slala05_61030 [Streptomyces lavendulae subsp. lavendulae]
MPPREIAAFLPHITEVVRRVQAGLDAQGAQIALAGEGAAAPPSAMGRVDARGPHGPRARATRGAPGQRALPLGLLSADAGGTSVPG